MKNDFTIIKKEDKINIVANEIDIQYDKEGWLDVDEKAVLIRATNGIASLSLKGLKKFIEIIENK